MGKIATVVVKEVNDPKMLRANYAYNSTSFAVNKGS